MGANSIEKYLIQIEDVLETSRAVLFSGKVAVDKAQIYAIMKIMRLNPPTELMDADSMKKYLTKIEDVLESSKTVPFSSRVAVEKDQIYEIIDEIRLNLPTELKESKKLVENKDKFLRDAEKRSESAIENARQEAESILQDDYNKAEKMISEHQIYKTAEEEADLIMQEAKHDAKNIRINAVDYADEILSKAETAMRATIDSIEKNHTSAQEYYNRILDTLYENRQELRS